MESKVGFILALIGGILNLLGGIFWIMVVLAGKSFFGMDVLKTALESSGSSWFLGVWIVVAVSYIISGIVSIIAAVMINNPRQVKTGGILALIFGIIGGTNILTIIGGVLGLIAAGKK